MRWLLGAFSEPLPYRAALYFLIGLPLGVFDFTLMVTGLSLGLGLTVTIIGIPVLVGSLLVARAQATVERRLAVSLIDSPIPTVKRMIAPATGAFWPRLRSLITERRTWNEVAYLLLRLPMGVADFVFITTLLALIASGVVQPILVSLGVESQIGTWEIDTIAEALAFVPVSLVFLLVAPRLIIGWSGLSRRFASSLLGTVSSKEFDREVKIVLTGSDAADAFDIHRKLETRLGRGSFLTATRLQASLLRLCDSNEVEVQYDGDAAVYSLR